MKKSDTIELLAAALSTAQGEFPTVKKDAANPFFKSKYADLASIIEAVRPILAKYGLSFSHIPDAETSTVECMIMHKSGQWLSGTYPINPVKTDPQGVGSCYTYAKRYSISAMLGIAVSDEDDDGERAMGRDIPSNRPKTPYNDSKVSTQGQDKQNAPQVNPDAAKAEAEMELKRSAFEGVKSRLLNDLMLKDDTKRREFIKRVVGTKPLNKYTDEDFKKLNAEIDKAKSDDEFKF